MSWNGNLDNKFELLDRTGRRGAENRMGYFGIVGIVLTLSQAEAHFSNHRAGLASLQDSKGDSSVNKEIFSRRVCLKR